MIFGHRNIWLDFSLWRILENQIRSFEKGKRSKNKLITVPSTTDLEQDLATEGHATPRQPTVHSRATTSEYGMLSYGHTSYGRSSWYKESSGYDHDFSDMTLEDFSDITSYTDHHQNNNEEKREENGSKKMDEG